jgi:hypothetical protein
MGITNETRRSSYEEILETLGKRQIDVFKELSLLGENGATANELAYKMYLKGYFVTPERNRVHPRLHELVKDKVVYIKEKKVCDITKRICAVYVAKEEF